ADARLPRAVAAGLADPQAKGDAPGPCGAAAGGSGGGVERSPGESATAVAAAMVANPLADAQEELDRARAKDDAPGTGVSRGAGVGARCRAAGSRGGGPEDSGRRGRATEDSPCRRTGASAA